MKLAAFTLGCKVNVYDTEAMLEIFTDKGYEIVDFEEKADIYLINTCTVTNLGDKKSRQMIRRAVKQNPDAIVVASGCYAQVSPEELKKIEGVNLIIGTKDRSKIVEIIEEYKNNNQTSSEVFVEDIMKERIYEPLNVKGLKNKTRAYLKIQEGCDRFCSYCIIPFARGPVRSRPADEVVTEVKSLVENGFKEVVLAGIHVVSYGKDLKNTNLVDLVKKVHAIDGLERIRFSSVEPTLITKEFVNELLQMPKICSHFHLSLQSGSANTLREMNRKYSIEEYEKALELLRQSFPNIGITTDIIVGFPGETEDDFNDSYEFCKKSGFSKMHVFPFSPKKGTKAADMEKQIDKNTKEIRAKKFGLLDKELGNKFLDAQINRIENVLFETKKENNIYEGYSSNYILVQVESEFDIRNKILPVILKSHINEKMFGTLK